MGNKVREIPRWKTSQLPPNFFKESYFLRNLPVIFTDLTKDWAAIGKWTPDLIVDKYGDKRATGLTWEGSEIDDFLHYTRRTTTIREWRDLILHPEQPNKRAYLTFPVFQVMPDMMKDIRPVDPYFCLPRGYPAALRRKAKKPASLWFGAKGQVSPMHFDVSQNILVQVYGTKRMKLYPPDQSKYLYWPCDHDAPFSFHNVNWTPVNADNPDLEKHPLFAQAEGIEITLEPGDALYLPVRWWHFTTSVTDSLSVNFFWQTHWTMLRNADLVLPTFKRMTKARLTAG